jgi:phosphoglycerate dehydrogenase-like enzyme
MVVERLAGSVEARAQELGVPLRAVRVDRDGQPLDDPSGAEVLLRAGGLRVQGLRRLLREVPSIRWVQAISAGVDGLLVPEIVESEITLTRVRGVHDGPVAEFAMGLILLAAKRLRAYLKAQERREWFEAVQPAVLAGSSLTIVGYGEIGKALGRRARAFEMRVVGVRRRPRPDEHADEVVGLDRLHEALARADYVVLAAPATSETNHLIGAAELKAMQAHAFLINVGRGSLVDEDALDEALRSGRVAGALLDTVSVEPLPKDHPLWSNPKVVITPHMAGLRPIGTIGGPQLDQFLDNIRRFARGDPLLNVVDKTLGY